MRVQGYYNDKHFKTSIECLGNLNMEKVQEI